MLRLTSFIFWEHPKPPRYLREALGNTRNRPATVRKLSGIPETVPLPFECFRVRYFLLMVSVLRNEG